MNRMKDVLSALRAELGVVPEIEPPADMWSRFEARLDADSPSRSVRIARACRLAPAGKLVLVPTRS